MNHSNQDGPDASLAPESRPRLGEPLPARLYPADLMRIFQIKQARFYQLLKAGKFDRFELKPTIGRRAWSGRLVQRYLDGEPGASRFTLMKTGARERKGGDA